MARNVEQIWGAMLTTKATLPELDPLTSTSKTSVWGLILYVCAVAIKIVEDLNELAIRQIEERGNELFQGSVQWYAQETLEYQHGDILVYDRETGRYDYQVDDPSAKVVKLSAATDDSAGQVFVKAAALDSITELPKPLDTAELNGLIAYWEQKKFAGTNLLVTSIDGDKLEIGYRVRYQGTVMSEFGELLSVPGVFPVENAIQNYLLEFGITNFAGIFQLEKMTDAVQSARGVVNSTPTVANARKFDDSTLYDIMSDPDQTYETIAGYMIVDPAFPLNVTITYVAV